MSEPSSSTPSKPSTSTTSQTNSNPTSLEKFSLAFQTISPASDFQTTPGVRYSLLFGIMSGVSVGVLRFLFASRKGLISTAGTSGGSTGRGGVMGGRGLKEVAMACNWAAGAFAVGSIGAWQTNKSQTVAEATRMTSLIDEVKARRSSRMDATGKGGGERATDRGIGGIIMGEQGKEMLRERVRLAEAKEAGKSA